MRRTSNLHTNICKFDRSSCTVSSDSICRLPSDQCQTSLPCFLPPVHQHTELTGAPEVHPAIVSLPAGFLLMIKILRVHPWRDDGFCLAKPFNLRTQQTVSNAVSKCDWLQSLLGSAHQAIFLRVDNRGCHKLCVVRISCDLADAVCAVLRVDIVLDNCLGLAVPQLCSDCCISIPRRLFRFHFAMTVSFPFRDDCFVSR